MKGAVLNLLSDFFLYVSIAGGILFLFFCHAYTKTDRIFKKALSSRNFELIKIEHTHLTFAVTPKRKWWSKYIRGQYGRPWEVIKYRMITFNHSGKQQTMLAAVYLAPFVKPQLFFEKNISNINAPVL